jgi:hypothetical protein
MLGCANFSFSSELITHNDLSECSPEELKKEFERFTTKFAPPKNILFLLRQIIRLMEKFIGMSVLNMFHIIFQESQSALKRSKSSLL